MSDQFCGPDGRHVVYVGATFCARCGARLPDPAATRPAVANGAPAAIADKTEIVAWASGANSILAIAGQGGDHRVVRLDPNRDSSAMRVVELGPTADPMELVVAPVGGRRGIYLIYGDRVDVVMSGQLHSLAAPAGTRIVGATLSDRNELWVACIDEAGGLTLLTGAPSNWRTDRRAVIPGFGGHGSRFLSLAVRSLGAQGVEALVWGDGKAAVVIDRAVPILRERHDAPPLRSTLLGRRQANAPLILQGLWQEADPCLVPITTTSDQDIGVGAVMVVDGELKVTRVGEQQVYAAAMTGAGTILLREEKTVVEIMPDGHSSRVSSPQIAGVVSGCLLDRGAVLRVRLADGSFSDELVSADGVTPLGPSINELPLLPPIVNHGRLWLVSDGQDGRVLRGLPMSARQGDRFAS